MSLSPKTRQALKGKAHKLKPVIMIGNNGLTTAVNKEIDHALLDHELIKVRILSNDRELRRQIFKQICQDNSAELIQVIGSIGVIYRIKEDK